MTKRLYGIRGAVCCGNTEQEILDGVEKMCWSVLQDNNLTAEDIVSIQFTVTSDLDALNPAAALRRSKCGQIVKNCALFCSAEPYIKGSLKQVVRLLITAYMPENSNPVHCYTGGAEVLRPDFVTKKSVTI